MASSFDGFLQQAWADHADQPEAVAARLRTDTPAPQTAEQLAALTRFVVHLCGEHLGAFDDGRWRLTALARHPLADATVQSALRVGAAGLTLAEGRAADTRELSAEEHVRSEAAAAAICLGRRQTERAMSLLQSARERLAALPSAGVASHRALAAACNNMAWELHDRGAERSAEDNAAMIEIAVASRLHWEKAGTWLEVERADYALALCHLAADRANEALSFAAQCLAGCTQNAAPPYEYFYAHEALARVQHARGDHAAGAGHIAEAQAAFAQLDTANQDACRPSLDTLRALGR